MKKVLRIITRLNIGGPAIHTVLVSSELNRNGSFSDVLVCGKASDSEGDMSYLARQKGLSPIVIPELGRDISIANDIKAFFSLLDIIRRERPDIVHTHTAKAGTLGRLAAIVAGVPIKIHTFHGHVFDGYFSPLKARLFVAIEKMLAFFTDKVVVVSERVRDDIVRDLKVVAPARSVVIPLGLELDRFLACEEKKGLFRRSMDIPDDVLLVGIVGRLVPIKNHKIFLEAAKRVITARPEMKVKFLVVGDGEMRQHLESYAKGLGIEAHVVFTGWAKDLESLYADLDVVALTSLNEGTPVSLIEAMAAAKSVIATDVGGVGDIVKDQERGLLVKSNDAEAFAAKLLVLLEDSAARSRFSACGRAFVSQKFSKERLLADVKALYGECLENRRMKRS